MSEILKWLEEKSERLIEECNSNSDPYKTVNNSFLEGFNYALANIQGLEQPQLNENQQKWINRLTINYSWYGETAQHALHATLQEPEMPDLPQNEFFQVLEVFSRWALEQEEE